jgi:predicted DsbA family dithiol-disulfide isomerase
MSRKLSIEIWSDVACPWCWVGKRRLETALAEFPHDVEVHWRSFELDPSAPKQLDPSIDYVERLARKYSRSREEAQGMIDRMTRVGADDGLDFRFDRARPGNTFDAHRLLHLAHEHGKQAELKERLFRAYMHEGRSIADHDVLLELATEVGLDRDRVAAVLGSDELGEAVRSDETLARELGINGVPFFVIAGRYGVSGAQPAEVLREALLEAATEAE